MAYVAVKGGQLAIEASLKLLETNKQSLKTKLTFSSIENNLGLLVDTVMSEASLYAPTLASRALLQSEGSVEEAVFLLRSYRSTVERLGYSTRLSTEKMIVERRISAAFKDIPGGQLLGASYDYSHRMIEFISDAQRYKKLQALFKNRSAIKSKALNSYPKVSTYLRTEGLLQEKPYDDTAPIDVTKKILTFPTKRCERLQTITRGMGQAVTAFGYAIIRGYGAAHPTVGELRQGWLPIYFDYLGEEDTEDSYYIGKMMVTEAEMYIPHIITTEENKEEVEISIGYGFVYGKNETKAIAMGILEDSLNTTDKKYPTQDEEFVLYHIDAIESTGFISHLKLPHYVTFQSKLDSMRKIKNNVNVGTEEVE